MAASEGAEVLQFEGFLLDPVRRTLSAPSGQNIDLKPKVFDALLALADRPGEIIPKSDLLEAVWPGVIVEENNLNQAISALRKSLAAHSPDNKLIVTVPGRGYQLAAQVNSISPGAPVAGDRPKAASVPPAAKPARPSGPEHYADRNFLLRPATWGSVLAVIVTIGALIAFMPDAPNATAREPSIAVLPFENLSGDPDQDYFARGVAEETLNLLTQIDELEVLARNSSFAYGSNADPRVISSDLVVANILSGAVRMDGDQVVVSAQLVDGGSGRAIWTREYSGDRSPDYIFYVQKQIAERVAGALSITFGAAQSSELTGQGTASLAAYDHYLRGMDMWRGLSPGDFQLEFRRAIELDPQYAAAWAGLAISTASTSWGGDTPEDAARIQKEAFGYATHALELDPNLSQTQAIFGAVSCTQFDWIGADRALQRSLEIGRSAEAVSHRMMLRLRMGRISDANRDRLEIERLDPVRRYAVLGAQSIRSAIGNEAENISEYETYTALNGWDAGAAANHLITLVHADADASEIRDVVESFAQRGDSGVAQLFSDLLAAFEEPAAAREILAASYDDQSFQHPFKWDLIPILAAWYGDDDLVLRIWGDELPINQVRTALIWGPAFSSARSRPEFQALIRQIGMDDYWREIAWADKCRPLSDDDFVCE